MPNQLRSRPLKQVLWSTSALGLMDSALRCLAVFIASPLLVGGLGQADYGLWVLVLAWAGWLEMLDLGMGNTAARYFASATSRRDSGETGVMVAFFRKHYGRMGWIVSLTTVIGALGLYLAWPAGREKHVAWLFLALGLAQGFVIRWRFYPALLKGNLRYQTIILAGSARVVLFAAGLAVLYYQGMTLERLLVLHVSLLIFEQLFFYLKGRGLAPRTALGVMERSKQQEILGYAGKNMVATVAQLFREKIDTQILAAFVSMSAVAQYAVGVRLPNLAMDLSNSLFGGHLVAGFASAIDSKSAEELTEDLLRVLRFSTWIGLSGCLLLYVLGPAFILRWLGADFVPAGEVLRILVPGLAFTVMQYPSYSILPALNKHGRLGLVYLASSAVNCVVSLILVRWIGMNGVVWGTTLELVLQGVIGMPLLIQQVLPLTAPRYFRLVLGRPLLLYGCCLLPLALGGMNLWKPVDYLEIGMAAGLLGGAFLLSGYFVVLNKKDRGFLCERVSAMLPVRKT